MKKIISLVLSLTMIAAVFAGCGNQEPVDTTPVPETTDATETTVAPEGEQTDSGALEILENIWALYEESEKFPVFGGNAKENYEDNTLGAPDVYDMSDLKMLCGNLLAPYDLIRNVDDVASMTHEMMANNFTAAVFHVTADADKFVEAYRENIQDNQWMCGMPEKMMLVIIDGEYVVMAYGLSDAINPFGNKLLMAYPRADVKYAAELA